MGWVETVYKNGRMFSEQFGLGPSVPVADNIYEVLQDEGVNARVIYTSYLPKDSKRPNRTFSHYVAVEVDELDRVTVIYDPTNPYNKGIHIIKPEILPMDYWPKGSLVQYPIDDAEKSYKSYIEKINNLSDDVLGLGITIRDKNLYKVFLGKSGGNSVLSGVSYDIDGNKKQFIIKNIGEIKKGSAEKSLSIVLNKAAQSKNLVSVQARIFNGDGKKYLEEIGFIADSDKGMDWYVTSSTKKTASISRKLSNRYDNRTEYSGIDRDRRPTVLFNKGSLAREDSTVYTEEMHNWWFDKLK